MEKENPGIQELRKALAEIICKSSDIDYWIHTFNASFGAVPASMVGTDREPELYEMISYLKSGEPRS
jgi:hypothetical protein